MQQAAPLLPGVCWCKNAYEAITGADAVAILTEWNEFRGLHMKRVKELMKAPVMIDLRNIYNPADMRAAGFSYRSEEHTSELQSLMRISYAVFCLKKKKNNHTLKIKATKKRIANTQYIDNTTKQTKP